MSYKPKFPLARAPQGLGYVMTVNVPVVGATTFNIPLEKVVKDAANDAVDAVKTRLPEIADAALPILQKQIVPPLLAQAKAAAQPLIKSNLDYGLAEAKKIGSNVALMVVLGFAIPVAASTWYLRREIRKGK